MWRDLYRVLFDGNVAGILLTKADGRIVDCNEPCARIFGFDSRKEMLAHSAWEFYFDRAEREALLDRLRKRRTCRAEEVCLRGKTGLPVWVLATRTVISYVEGRPALLQGTVIDITALKKAQTRLRDIKRAQSSATIPKGESARMSDLSKRLATLQHRVNQTLQPNNLPKIDRTEVQECLLALEEMKMLVAELEIRRLLGE